MKVLVDQQIAFHQAPSPAAAGAYLAAALECEAEDLIDDDAFLDAVSEVARFLNHPQRSPGESDQAPVREVQVEPDQDGSYRQCVAVPRDSDYGTVGDGFDGPGCPDGAEQSAFRSMQDQLPTRSFRERR